MKHTKGPWDIDWSTHCDGALIGQENGPGFVVVFKDRPNEKANAQLIAAAPEMLQNLKRARTALKFAKFESGAILQDVLKTIGEIEAIIDKIEGGE